MAGTILSALGLLALLLSCLAANHYPPWTSFHGEAAAFAALVLLCAGQLFVGPVDHWRGPMAMACGAILLLTAQWLAGQIPYGGDALLSGLYLVGACLAWWAGASSNARAHGEQQEHFHRLSVTLIAAAVLSVFVGLLQWLQMEPRLGIFAADRGPDMRVFANLGQPNQFATLCSMSAILTLWLFRRGKIVAWHLGCLLVWLAIGMTFTESRSGLLGAFAAGSLVIAGGWRLPDRRGLIKLVIGWWALLLVFAWIWPPLNEALFLQSSRAAQLTSDGARTTMWKQSLAAIADAPWFGYGWRQTMYAQKLAAVQAPGWLATDYAHNLMLDLMLWIGIPGAVLLGLGGLTWLLHRFFRIANERQLFLLCATVPFLVHSQFEFPFAYAYFLFPVAWMLGGLAIEQKARAEPARLSTTAGTLILLVLVAYAGLAFALAAEYLDLEEDYRVMRFELRRVGRTPADYQRPSVQLLTQLDALVKAGRLSPRRGMTAAELESLRTASERNGWATLDLIFATSLALNGQPEEASRRLVQITAVYGRETGRQTIAMFREQSTRFPELDRVEIREPSTKP